MPRKKYASVTEMMKGIGADPAFTDDLAQHLSQRQIVHALLALRGAAGLTQGEVAERFGCSQAKISKLEDAADGDISLGDLVRYADTVGRTVTISLSEKATTAVDQVKHHAFCIKDLTDHLARVAHVDDEIADGVAAFYKEAAFNLLHMLSNSAELLARLQDQAKQSTREREENPPLRVEVGAAGPPSQVVKKAKAPARAKRGRKAETKLGAGA